MLSLLLPGASPYSRKVRQWILPAIDAKTGSVQQKKAPAKRAPRKASTAAEKRPTVARRKKLARKVDEPAEDEEMDDPIEDDDEEIVVVHDEPEVASKEKGKKAVTKPEPAKKELVKKGRGKKAAAIEELEPEDEEEQLEEVEDEVIDVEEPKDAKRGARKVAATTEKKDIPTVLIPEKKKRMTKKGKDAAAKEEAEKEIAETQFEPMEVDPPAGHDETEDEQEKEIAPTPTQVHQAGMKGGVTGRKVLAGTMKGKGRGKKMEEPEVEDETRIEEDDLAMPMKALVPTAPPARGRAKKQGSSGDGDKGEEYRDLEKAFQELRARYNNLQEAKETEPERRLKEFRKNMKEKDAGLWSLSHVVYLTTLITDGNETERERLIESLRDDLKAQETFSSDTKVLQKKLTAKETEISKLQTKVQELSKSLQDQQNENQMVSAKLVQTQNQLVQVQSHRNNAQVPGSAVKPGYRGPLGNPKGNTSAAAADDAWIARAKEDLYADLCGLLILNVKKENDSNVFECVQTGINGRTLSPVIRPDGSWLILE